MADVELVAIVNSYNRLSLIQLGMPTLVAALNDCPFASAVVVFDANSTDGSLEWLREFAETTSAPPVQIICPAEGEDSSNAAGSNAACAWAARHYPKAQWYFLFESDNWIASARPVILARNLLRQEEKLAAAGFTVTKHSGQPAGFGTCLPTVFQFLIGQQLTLFLGLDRPNLRDGGSIDGCCWSVCDLVFTSPLLVRRRAWEESRGLDNSVFSFADCDVDWMWRLNKAGWRLAVIEIDGVVHDNKEQPSGWAARRVVQFHQARLQLLRTHRGEWVAWLKPLLLVRHCLEFMILLALCLFGYPRESLRKRWLLITGVMNDYKFGP